MAIVDTDTKSLIINQLTTDQLKELQEAGSVENGQVYVTVDPLYHDLSNIDAMTADRALITDGDGKIDVSSTTSTELGYVHGVTSDIQAQLDAKASNDDLALKAPIASPGLTGTPTAPTASSGTNTTQIATTAFVQTEISTRAPLESPALTGTPTAPTAEASTNNTQIATTEFVNTAVSNATPGVDNLTVETFDNSSAQGGSTHDLRVKDDGISIEKMNSSAFTLKTSESKNSATIPSYAKVEEMVANATPVVDNSTISYNSSTELQAIGTINKNGGGTLYNWRGTLAEYEAAVAAGTIQDNWICVITDDFNPGVTFSGEIVSVTKTFETASNHVEFTEKCRSKNYLTVFQDRVFIYPSEYTLDNDFMGITFTSNIEQGSTVTVNYFKGVPSEKVDELIEAAKDVGIKKYESTSSYSTNELVVNVDINNEVKIYQSLSDNNTSSLSDTTKWKEVSLGGGGEIGDIGFAPLGIDESLNLRRYLNGQVISQAQFKSFTTKVKSAVALFPSLATTESNWQAEKALSKFGQCGKFVVDDDAGTIRLPCVVNAQGLVDLQYLGAIKNESLPNINVSSCGIGETNSMFHRTAGYPSSYLARGDGVSGLITEPFASLTSSTYQDNAPVQQEAVQYPYYIQVATGIEETLPAIREYKVNNSDFFGKSMYSDVAPDNASWLVSNGQWNARTVYPDYYDWLVEQMNAGVSGFVASTGEYTDYDFVINTADQTFRLPLKNGQEGIFANGVKGNGIAIGLADKFGDGHALGGQAVETDNGYSYTLASQRAKYGSPVGTAMGGYATPAANTTFGLTTDPSKSGMVVDKTVPSGWNLYYYVGDTVQDASLINAGRVLNEVAELKSHTIVETYRNGTEWYRLYADGWVEQGGYSFPAAPTVTFLKPFSDNNYNLLTQPCGKTATSGAATYMSTINHTTTSFSAISNTNISGYEWRACGYIR